MGPRRSQTESGIVEISDLGVFGLLFINVGFKFLSPITAEIPRVRDGPKWGPGFSKYPILQFLGPLFIHAGSKFLSLITAEIPWVRDGPNWGPGFSKYPILQFLGPLFIHAGSKFLSLITAEISRVQKGPRRSQMGFQIGPGPAFPNIRIKDLFGGY